MDDYWQVQAERGAYYLVRAVADIYQDEGAPTDQQASLALVALVLLLPAPPCRPAGVSPLVYVEHLRQVLTKAVQQMARTAEASAPEADTEPPEAPAKAAPRAEVRPAPKHRRAK